MRGGVKALENLDVTFARIMFPWIIEILKWLPAIIGMASGT
jgi:hypothetical protein